MDLLEVCYTDVEIEGKAFQVRTFYYRKEDKTKKTLVFTHGYMGSIVYYLASLKGLAEKYRLVLFDNCCKGLNTRLVYTEAINTVDTCESWLRDFMTNTID